MKASGRIFLLSLLVAAGTAVGTVWPCPGPGPVLGLLLALSGGVLALLGGLRRAAGWVVPVLLVLCGLLGAWTEQRCGQPGMPAWLETATGEAARRLRATIDGIPFRRESTAPLVKALLSGERSGLSRETVAIFRRSGASHLLALSGLHAGVLYVLLSRALAILGNGPSIKRFRSVVILIAAGFYTLMTGASPSLVRAFLFILIRETARLAGRDADPVGVLALALCIQLVLRPSVLRSVGFQLSYAAIAGIFLLYPPLERAYPSPRVRGAVPRWLVRHEPQRLLWNSAALSLACQAFTAPVAWLYFKSFPVYFLITNLLAIPLTSLLVTTAVLTLGVHALLPTSGADSLLTALTDRLAGLLEEILGIIAAM